MTSYTDYTAVNDANFKKFLRAIGNEKYGILGRIGEGAFSKVLNAKRVDNPDLLSDTARFAVKLINFNGLSNKYYSNERNILQQLKHSNITPLLDNYQFSYEGEEFGAIVSERMKCDLFDFIKKFQLSAKQIKFIFRKICRALAYIHSKNIVHLDIKPDNVLINYVLSPNGSVKIKSVKICDFGCSVDMKKTKYLPPSFGTSDYKSPEAVLLSAPVNDCEDSCSNNINNNNNNNNNNSNNSNDNKNINIEEVIRVEDDEETHSKHQKKKKEKKHCKRTTAPKKNKPPKVNFVDENIDLEKMDVWSAGVLLFVIITHIKPFDIRPGHLHSYGLDLLREFTDGELIIDLLQSIFVIDPSLRPSFQTILLHPYFHSLKSCKKEKRTSEEDECDPIFTSIPLGKLTKKEFQNSLKYYKK